MKTNLYFIILFTAVSVNSYGNGLMLFQQRLTDGVETEPNEFPSILNPGMHYCAATLISPKWALTAASCRFWKKLKIVAGDYDILGTDGTEQTVGIRRFIPHENYGTPTIFSNDIALLELDRKLELNEFVGAAVLPPPDYSPRDYAILAGWGINGYGQLSFRLKKVIVPIVSNKLCKKAYGCKSIDRSMICAGDVQKDSCIGDSGGPLYCDFFEDGKGILCGIVSWGRGCGLSGYPGVYTRTSFYIDWIKKYTGQSFSIST